MIENRCGCSRLQTDFIDFLLMKCFSESLSLTTKSNVIEKSYMLLQDGLWDPYGDKHMGECGELCVADHQLTRQQLDEHATTSIQRARDCDQQGITAWVSLSSSIATVLFDCC